MYFNYNTKMSALNILSKAGKAKSSFTYSLSLSLSPSLYLYLSRGKTQQFFAP